MCESILIVFVQHHCFDIDTNNLLKNFSEGMALDIVKVKYGLNATKVAALKDFDRLQNDMKSAMVSPACK